MIDKNKYKGHTPAPWRVEGELTEGDDNIGQSGDSTLSIHGDGLYIGEVGADYGIHETIANALLMADAPLLFAEVKRLREGLRTEKNLKLWEKAEVKRLREAIADIATNMEAADASYMGGFIEDLWKVIE